MPENTAVLRARRTIQQAVDREKESYAPPPAALASAPPEVRPRPRPGGAEQHLTVNPLAAAGGGGATRDVLTRVSPIDGTIEYVTKSENVLYSSAWGQDHGHNADIVPAAPMSRDEQRHLHTLEKASRKKKRANAKEMQYSIGSTKLGLSGPARGPTQQSDGAYVI